MMTALSLKPIGIDTIQGVVIFKYKLVQYILTYVFRSIQFLKNHHILTSSHNGEKVI